MKTKQIFKKLSSQIHLLADSSLIGRDPEYFDKGLVGGSAIISSNIWATKVSESARDASGYGTYSVTTFKGKHNKKLSIIAAYIAVNKGSDIGIESLYAQQVILYECECKHQGISPRSHFCPRAHAIRRLNNLIQDASNVTMPLYFFLTLTKHCQNVLHMLKSNLILLNGSGFNVA